MYGAFVSSACADGWPAKQQLVLQAGRQLQSRCRPLACMTKWMASERLCSPAPSCSLPRLIGPARRKTLLIIMLTVVDSQHSAPHNYPVAAGGTFAEVLAQIYALLHPPQEQALVLQGSNVQEAGDALDDRCSLSCGTELRHVDLSPTQLTARQARVKRAHSHACMPAMRDAMELCYAQMSCAAVTYRM